MPKINLLTISKQIYEAARGGKIAEAKSLLESAEKAGITHVVDSYVDLETGNTSLHEAALLGNAELIELLLKYGANSNKTNRLNKTPLKSLNLKTTNPLLVISGTHRKVAINTSNEALSLFSLEHRHQIKNKNGVTVTVYGVNSEGELCVWIEGSSGIGILKGIKNRNDLIEADYVLGKKPDLTKSSKIYSLWAKKSDTLKLRTRNGDTIKINSSADSLRDIFNIAFLQRIKIRGNKFVTAYGIDPATRKLCCLVDGDYGVGLVDATCYQELIKRANILPEIGTINASIIIKGYKANIFTINSDPKDLEEAKLTPFQKYSTSEGSATCYGLSDDKKAILLNDKNQTLQIIDTKEITPLFEEARKKLESIEKPILETNLKTLLDKLHKLYNHILEQIKQKPFHSLLEANEAKTTLDALHLILNDPQHNNEEQLKNALKQFLETRWDRIKDNPHFSYISNTKSLINQLCIHVAQIIDPAHRNELLIPTVKEYSEDTNGTDINQLEFGQFILTADGKQFIDLISLHKNAFEVIKQAQKDYYQISEFSKVLINGIEEKKEEQRNLKSDEITRLRSFSHIDKFMNAAEQKLKATKLTALGALQDLRKGLLLGDSYANAKFEYDAGILAYDRLIWFSDKYNTMPPNEKAKLNNIKLKHMRGTLGDFINNRLLLKSGATKNSQGNLDVYYCLHLNGGALEQILELHYKELEKIPMGSAAFKEIDVDHQFDSAYETVMESLRSPDICIEPVTLPDDINFFESHKVEIDNYIKAILNNTITDEPAFLQKIKNTPFNIQQVKKVLSKYLDYPHEVRSKLINFMLFRPATKDLWQVRAIEIARTYIDETVKLLTEFLLNRNLGEAKFSEDYLKIISKFSKIYGNDADKILSDHISKIQYLTPDEHALVIFLNGKISNEVKLLNDKKEDISKDNLLGITCAKNLLSELFSSILSNNISNDQLDKIKLIHSILMRESLEGSKLTHLINSEAEKIDASKNVIALIQKFLSETKFTTKEEIYSQSKLINASKDIEKLIDLLLNKDCDISQHQDEYYTLVSRINSVLTQKSEIFTALNQILSKKPISDYVKNWIRDFAEVIATKPQGSIVEAVKLQNKNNSNELLKQTINELKQESICLAYSTNLQNLIHTNHAIFRPLEPQDIENIITNAAIGLHSIIKSNLVSLISIAHPDNYNREAVEERCKEINNKTLLSHIIPNILNQDNSIYDNPTRFKTLMSYLHYQSVPENETKKIINELKLFPDQMSEDIKTRITKFLIDISKKETYHGPGLDAAEKIRLDHCRHEELRAEVKVLVSQQIRDLEKIKKNHTVGNSGSSFDRYNAAHKTIFKEALGDVKTPNTLLHLHASLDSGTIKLGALKTNIETITKEKLITPFIALNKKTDRVVKLRHWLQNILSKFDRLLFKQQKSSTIDIKNAQRSLVKNFHTFFSEAMQKDWNQPEEVIKPGIVR